MSQITRCCVFSQTLSKLRPAANRISHISSLYSKTYDNKRVTPILRCFSTNQKIDKSSPAKDSVKKIPKALLLSLRFGAAFFLVDIVLYAVSTCLFHTLLQAGVPEMTIFQAVFETSYDIDYWVNRYNLDETIFAAKGSEIAISLYASELTTLLRIPFDVRILYWLKQKGIFKGELF